ncbi:MAG: hypothetical protein OHK0046_07550 [Anaerolineae bacterium]
MLIAFAFVYSARAQSATETPLSAVIEADFRASEQTPLIGEPFQLVLTVLTPPEVLIVEWPVFTEDWGSLMLTSISEPQTTSLENGAVLYEQVFDARLWRTGDQRTPETFIGYQIIGTDEIRRVPITPVFFTVPSVLDSSDLNTLELRPDAPPIGFFYIPAWLIVTLLVLTGVGSWYGRRWYLARRARLAALPATPSQTPAEAALQALARLRETQMPPEAVYAEVSWRLREYIAAVFAISAQDMTTQELMTALAGSLLAEHQGQLLGLLERTDIVKYSGAALDPQSAPRLINAAIRWITAQETARLAPANTEYAGTDEVLHG